MVLTLGVKTNKFSLLRGVGEASTRLDSRNRIQCKYDRSAHRIDQTDANQDTITNYVMGHDIYAPMLNLPLTFDIVIGVLNFGPGGILRTNGPKWTSRIGFCYCNSHANKSSSIVIRVHVV